MGSKKHTTEKTSQLRREYEALAAPVLAAGRVQEMAQFIQHGSTTTLEHVQGVAWMAFMLARRWGWHVDEQALVRGALLHDYYLYDWHKPGHGHLHGFFHPRKALEQAECDFSLSDCERDIIVHHMWPLTWPAPRSREAWLVCIADKIVSTRETLRR